MTPHPKSPRIVQGGQGRSGDSLMDDAWGVFIAVALILVGIGIGVVFS